ncbi:hypothetical protein CDD81_971 [Ophiocordyceps australis]|uniref:Uncharacterized protein n=1 Tax=Ophiocordyceps australis TaxID=1399860 RepID=A0A2C5XUR3_9HYPO|nr:hypothetical protein CDD81_971 [Ophiocordyceps australis]
MTDGEVRALAKELIGEGHEVGDHGRNSINWKRQLHMRLHWEISSPRSLLVILRRNLLIERAIAESQMLWTPPKVLEKLDPDKGIFYRDRSAAAYPKHPMEPTVVAVMKMQPAALCLDVVACSHTFRTLLDYVLEKDTALRMMLEVVGETIHLIRRENSPTEQILGIKGYGHSFPDACTTWDAGLESSLSHQRVIRYCLGGLQVMVRFEPDGRLARDDEMTLNAKGKISENRTHTCELKAIQQTELKVGTGGHVVLQDDLFDIKTRSLLYRKNEDTVAEQLPRLWIAQIPNIILARHQLGRFEDVSVKDVRDRIETWEKENEAVVNRFVGLLRCIMEIAMRHEATQLELTRKEGGDLEVRKRLPDAGEAFSTAVRAQWEDWLQEGRDEDSDEEEGANLYASSDDDSQGWSDDDKDLTHCTEECGYCGKCSF